MIQTNTIIKVLRHVLTVFYTYSTVHLTQMYLTEPMLHVQVHIHVHVLYIHVHVIQIEAEQKLKPELTNNISKAVTKLD